jgi:hypothetical protein
MKFTSDAANPLCNSRPLFSRLSSAGMESIEGLIVVKSDGEGRGVTCRAIMPTPKT